MLDPSELALHGLTLKQLANAEQLADILDLDAVAVAGSLEAAVAAGYALAARGSYMITPAGRAELDSRYPIAFAGQRADGELVSALGEFEFGINKQILALMTGWQTITIDGVEHPNDHSDAEHDAKIIDKLARLHERAETILAPFAGADPLTKRFVSRLDGALQRVDHGEHEYVSDVRRDSYHTVWYQMHEHLLRMMGQERDE
ncbi:MAG: hypothetical protein QM673_10985 [Gordonia sp. (in: high G+C Gram-positive bacteria)]